MSIFFIYVCLLKMLFRLIIIFASFFFFCQSAFSGALADRLEQYPQWYNKPSVKAAQGDLYYPQWMAGTWQVESVLIEQIAPLAPKILTPGFQNNQQYLNQSINFLVRFGSAYFLPKNRVFSVKLNDNNSNKPVVADRVFNGEKIAAAYLGKKNILQVKIDPDNPNKQITFLEGERTLISIVTGRATENTDSHHFLTTELTKQLFKSPERIYLNEVETTSDYQLITPQEISANQITAIYLSPQDPDYFRASDRPVALYRYQLKLKKV